MRGVTTGHFDEQGNACLKFHIRGVAPDGIELSGIIDTGFTGFIQLPIEHAFSLKLPLEGTVHSSLADDSTSTAYTALGTVTYDGIEKTGVVVLEPYASDILIGMAFLRQFKLALIMMAGSVTLMNEDWIADITKKAEEKQRRASDPSAAAKVDPA